ncbi:MAG: Txe/YoeB family addiction module toxin [Desulfuromonadales bacterium]|nr:Txe/YoeB family addiction module toxin [Desulfuromonadales bacterium]
MILSWAQNAWDDYLYWQQADKQIFQRINTLIRETIRHPFDGIGNPEPLKHYWTGYWSRRIDRTHRLVYKVTDDSLIIVQCRFHY